MQDRILGSAEYLAFPETQRLQALLDYDILDTPPEAIFDELARIAASVCDTPIALVSLIDATRQWFKAKVGLEVGEAPREFAFCSHAIQSSEPMIVQDARIDPRFAANPLVISQPSIRFYAGAPLIAPGGQALGTLCVIDRVPRELTAERIEALKLLSRHVVAQLELRKRVNELSQSNAREKPQMGPLRKTRQRLDGPLREDEAKMGQSVQYNPQTGLANRALFLSRLAQSLVTAAGRGAQLTVFVLDMQRFDLVSETVGQSVLDELLREVAQRLIHVFDDPIHVAHLESDRFAALSIGGRSAATASAQLEGVLLPALRAPYAVGDQELRLTFKAGVAIAPSRTIAAETLLHRAKTALIKAKESKEDYALFSAELETRVAGIISFETKLRRAIELRQFELHYQPKVSLLDGTVSGVESLIRWRDPAPEVRSEDPSTAWVPPARFIPALEATGLILEVGRWALEQAAHDYLDWQRRGLPAPRIAVNISPLQLRHKNFLTEIRAILDAHAHAPGLDIELTEAVLMEEVDRCIESLHMLRQWGIRVAIDDFGSGYSSLRYIARLPIDVLKIDMAFIHAMPKSPDNYGDCVERDLPRPWPAPENRGRGCRNRGAAQPAAAASLR